MTPEELKAKWNQEATLTLMDTPESDHPFRDGYLAACEARHREYQERVATLTEAATDVLTLIDFGLPLDEIDKKKIERLRAALSTPTS